jgi:hypothetical protein
MYVAVVLSITIRDAYAGTDMFDVISNVVAAARVTALPDVVAPLVNKDTVTLAAVLVILEATTWLTLNTLEDPLVLAINTSVDVFAGVKKFV